MQKTVLRLTSPIRLSACLFALIGRCGKRTYRHPGACGWGPVCIVFNRWAILASGSQDNTRSMLRHVPQPLMEGAVASLQRRTFRARQPAEGIVQRDGGKVGVEPG